MAMSGKSYGDIVGEHLHRNPSLETSKSSVELEQGMLTRNKIQKSEFYSSEKYEESRQYQSSFGKSTNGQHHNDKEFITNRHTHNLLAQHEGRETTQQEHSMVTRSYHHHHQTEEMIQSSSVKTDTDQKHNFMSYVESAKLKDQQMKSAHESQNTAKFDDVKIEVNGPVEFNPVARSTSTSSSSSSSSGLKEGGHCPPGVSGIKVTRHESDSSMSNEEIVRQHLNQFNEKEPEVVLMIYFFDLIQLFRTELHSMVFL